MTRSDQAYRTFRCNHCTPHVASFHVEIGVRNRPRKWVLDRTRELVTAAIEKARGIAAPSFRDTVVQKESLAQQLKVPTHQVAHALHRLSLEGLVIQPEHRSTHDSSRDSMTFGSDSSRCADNYYLVIN